MAPTSRGSAPLRESTLRALKRECPRCGAKPGHPCQTAPGGWPYPPRQVHAARRESTDLAHDDLTGRRCLRCMDTVSAAAGFFELTRQPSGDRFTLCSLDCLERFVRGAE